MKPMFAHVAARYASKAKFASVNIEEVPQLLRSIRYVPTFAVYKNEHLVGRIVGAKPLKEFQKRMETLILNGNASNEEKLHQITLAGKFD